MSYTKSGWPQKVTPNLQPYFNRRFEIGIESSCLLWGIRIIIPQNLRAKFFVLSMITILECPEEKAIARSYVWWSGLNKDIEDQPN